MGGGGVVSASGAAPMLGGSGQGGVLDHAQVCAVLCCAASRDLLCPGLCRQRRGSRSARLACLPAASAARRALTNPSSTACACPSRTPHPLQLQQMAGMGAYGMPSPYASGGMHGAGIPFFGGGVN